MPPDQTAAQRTAARLPFVVAILTGSFLLFLVQPMVARLALPRLGGAPAVWNSAMLVYQALLLGGYAYAHALGRLRPRLQAIVHLGVLLTAACWLPIGLAGMTEPATAAPVLWVPWLLLASIGPLFLAVSAGAPLLQRWFALASGGRDPYALYAASNLGSFAGLLAYPLLVEPALSLSRQRLLWSAGYGVLALLLAGCGSFLPRRAAQASRPAAVSPPASPGRVLHWIALAFVPSGLMLATSSYITTDIVAMPLLWVLPLGLYLLSFTVAFADQRDTADLLTRFAPITILLFGSGMMAGYAEMPFFSATIALVLLFMASVALHTRLYRLRPAPDRLTGFYLAMAAGGALGGLFAGLIAPVIFDWTYEYPLLILGAGLLVPQVYLSGGLRALWFDPVRGRVALATVVLALEMVFVLRFVGPAALFGGDRPGIAFLVLGAVGLATIGTRWPYMLVLTEALVLLGGYRAVALSIEGDVRTRSYFGIYTVHGTDRIHELDHGSTIHGIQLRGSPARERTPTTYYARGSGVGQAMVAAQALYGPAARIGVVGLGTGTLACYAQPGQHWRFYEIDPAVVRIASDPSKFSYLARCRPHPSIRIGDARLSLAQDQAASLDLLALDAFSSDAVPMHLLTGEAFATYARVVQPSGLLLVHISNRFLDLAPVVAAAARAGGWQAREFDYTPPSKVDQAVPSAWIALSRNPDAIAALTAGKPGWRPLRARADFRGWTDDYASILPLLRLWR